MELTIDETGVSGLSSDLLDQMNLGGTREVSRLSEIQYDNAAQQWTVRCVLKCEDTAGPDGILIQSRLLSRVLFASKSHAECLAWEHKNEHQLRSMRWAQ